MADTTTTRFTFRLLLLLTSVVLATTVGSKNEQASLGSSAQNYASLSKSANSVASGSTHARLNARQESFDRATEDGTRKDAPISEDGEYEIEEMDDEENDEEDEDDEDGDEVDEYEDELKRIAVSRVAASRDEGTRYDASSNGSMPSSRNQSERLKKFVSRERSDGTPEYEISMTNVAEFKDDEEVAQLLRYKQKSPLFSVEEKKLNLEDPGLEAKVKRVPTVKKELSTQKEILSGNETELSVPKRLVASVDVANRLDDDSKREMGLGVPSNSRDGYEQPVRDDTDLEEDYSQRVGPASGDIFRKPDKRQPSEVNAPRYHYPDAYSSEEELHRELQALGLEALADNLMDLLSRLAEDPRLRERAHRILADLAAVPFTREAFADSQKRGYTSDSLMSMSLDEFDSTSVAATTKKPKKKKKRRKKKKLRQRLENATSIHESTIGTKATPIPPILTSTATNWPATTQAQWRLVAERLFASPWSEEHRETAHEATKVLSIKDRLATMDEKQRVNLKSLNDERQALMLQSAREYSQPRRLHYGKVNTHEKDSSGTSREEKAGKTYDSGIESPLMDYDSSEARTYQQRPNNRDPYDRYGHYPRERTADYGTDRLAQERDYDEIYRESADHPNRRPFASTQLFRPLSGEYASAKTWQDSRYDYGIPWKDKERKGLDGIVGTNGDWPWSAASREYKVWTPRYRDNWSRDRNYWQRLDSVQDQLEDIMSDDVNENDLPLRNRQRETQEQSWRMRHGDIPRWQIERNVGVPSWQMRDRPMNLGREISTPAKTDENKNRSDLIDAAIAQPIVKDKTIVPKITMKTWNSLTSDPATWPFKLTGAKPWPKDKNGNSYNPNADLVRKLGLDKQDRSISSPKDDQSVGEPILSQTPSNKMMDNNGIEAKYHKTDKSPIGWPKKLNDMDQWRGKPRLESDHSRQRGETGREWPTGMSEEKIWSGQSPVSPKISSVGAWVMPADQSTWRPYDLKHKVYGHASEERGEWNERANSEETVRSYWPSKDQGAAMWPRKNNDWNVIASVYTPDKSATNDRASNWPAKWRQFAYHKVTASPYAKSGTPNNVEGGTKARNSYIAVSAVSPPKYANDWRKNDIEETQLDRSSGTNRDLSLDRDEPSNQLRESTRITKERWNERPITSHAKLKDRNDDGNDPLEHQLEELRRANHWQHELRDQSQKRAVTGGNSTGALVTTQASRAHSAKTSSVDNEILKNHMENVTLAPNQTQGNKNVTK